MPKLSSRPTMRSLAAEAGVSAMTVSLALRGHPSIPQTTRERILRAARTQGYRPDPMLTHLMQHLRKSRKLRAGENLALLTALDAEFTRRLNAGASARAAELGYSLDRINMTAFQGRPAALSRALVARGITGVLLGPSSLPSDYTGLVDWEKFAAVAMTYSIFAPHVHRVVTHHFDNANRTFELLVKRGFRRIGMAMTREMEFRTNHSYTGAFQRLYLEQGLTLPPILYLDADEPSAVRQWHRRHKPEAVVVSNAHQVADFFQPALGQRVCSGIAFACLDYEEGAGVPGMDQLFETVGRHAIDALVTQIHLNARGLPAHPMISMVEGTWIDVPGARASVGKSA